MSLPRSQTGPFTPMPHGSQVAEFQNDASTTQSTNGKRISSGEKDASSPPESGPNLYEYYERRSVASGSQIPDTQGTIFRPQLRQLPREDELTQRTDTPHYPAGSPGVPPDVAQLQPIHRHVTPPGPDRQSQPPVPSFTAAPAETSPVHRTNSQIADLLNPSPQPNLIQVEERNVDNFHREISDKTSGLSVEQLEQVNSVLMDALWKSRGEWDRSKVLEEVSDAFNEVMADMQESGQDFAPSSWGRRAPV